MSHVSKRNYFVEIKLLLLLLPAPLHNNHQSFILCMIISYITRFIKKTHTYTKMSLLINNSEFHVDVCFIFSLFLCFFLPLCLQLHRSYPLVSFVPTTWLTSLQTMLLSKLKSTPLPLVLVAYPHTYCLYRGILNTFFY